MTTPTSNPAPAQNRISWSVWRMGNAFCILLIFFAPWLQTCRGSTLGREPAALNGFVTLWLVLMLSTGIFNIYPVIALGLIAFLGYIPTTLFMAFGPQRWVNRPFWNKLARGLLISSAVGLFFGAVLRIGYPDSLELLWGYGLAWIALASAVGVEVLTYRERKQIEPTRPKPLEKAEQPPQA